MSACEHPWWIEGDYTDATCKACGVPGWYCPACSPDPDDDADEDCTTCGGSGYVVVHELIARLTRELEEARACCKWEEGNQRRALEYWDGEYGTTLAEEFPYGCDTIEHVAEALIVARRELEEARERERAVRDEATGYLAEVAGTLADMHDGEECRFEGGEGCLACYAQRRIGEMQDALAARTTGEER